MALVATRPEIDHRTIKLVVGIVAILLPILCASFSHSPLRSISDSYYDQGWSSSIFVGFLFAISAFLSAYNGHSERQMLLSKVAAAASLLIALFPCACACHKELIPGVHYGAAAVMFLILTYFCFVFYRRAISKAHREAKVRASIYRACAVFIVLSIAALGLNAVLGFDEKWPRFVFLWESTGLWAFGVSWLTASRTVPLFTSREERFSPLRSANPA